MVLEYDGRHAGMFIAVGDPMPLADLAVPMGVAYSIFRSPKLAIAVLIGAQHPEPLTEWLDSAHEVCEGSSFLAEILSTNAEIPDGSHCHLLRGPFADLDDDLAKDLASRRSLAMRLPFSDEMLVLCDANSGRELCNKRARLLDTADFGLSRLARGSRPAAIRSGPLSPYDPVGSQATETLRTTAGAFGGNLALVRRLLRDVFDYEPPAELAAIEYEVQTLFAGARRRLRQAEAGEVDDEVAVTALDVAAAVGTDLTERLARLASQINVHVDAPDPWSQPTPYARAAERYALRAVRAVVLEMSHSIIEAKPSRVLVPVLGERFSAESGLLGPMSFITDSTAPTGRLITYPRRLVLRAGALPLLAGSVVAGQCDLEPLAERLVDGDLRPAGRELGVRLEQGSPEHRAAATARAATFLSDLAATAAYGPAYAFALARFTPGAIAPRDASSAPSPSIGLGERISLCLRLLRRLRINTRFSSKYVEGGLRSIRPELAELAMGLVAQRYDGRVATMRPVSAALTRGELVDEPPSLLLNALWMAVAGRTGYLNEVALYESLVSAVP
jgi:hypothetical protein